MLIGREDRHIVAEILERLLRPAQGRYDAVDLRTPRVRDYCKFHRGLLLTAIVYISVTKWDLTYWC
jgi:hypothetical protein